MDEQFVLEQVVVHRHEPFQFFFATRAVEALPEHEDYVPEPTAKGLRIHATSESVLEHAGAALSDMFAGELDFLPVGVKLKQHGSVVYEPIMNVRTETEAALLSRVSGALRARGVTVLEEDRRRRYVVTRGLGALRQLIGFGGTFRRLAGEHARLWIWLSHYAPIGPEDGQRAA